MTTQTFIYVGSDEKWEVFTIEEARKVCHKYIAEYKTDDEDFRDFLRTCAGIESMSFKDIMIYLKANVYKDLRVRFKTFSCPENVESKPELVDEDEVVRSKNVEALKVGGMTIHG